MQHSNETANMSKQASGASQVSTANSAVLASNLAGSGDGAFNGKPVMEQPLGKAFFSSHYMKWRVLIGSGMDAQIP